MKSFGQALAEVMDAKGMNQVELSQRSGIYQSYVSRVLSGKVEDPSFKKALAMARAVGVPMSEIIAIMDAG